MPGELSRHLQNPSYRDVCTDQTGHAEVVQLQFDPDQVSYAELLDLFFSLHNPTTRNRQGPDVGSQYRSGIYTTSEAQLAAARSYVQQLQADGRFDRPIVTEIEPAETFYAAEDYHQDYIETTGRACHVKNPW